MHRIVLQNLVAFLKQTVSVAHSGQRSLVRYRVCRFEFLPAEFVRTVRAILVLISDQEEI
jgi:hypothetical protein